MLLFPEIYKQIKGLTECCSRMNEKLHSLYMLNDNVTLICNH